MTEIKRPLIIIAGPTATGKTKLSVELAKIVDGEIISADSIQVYKGMDIGSAKVTKEEMCGIRHHLIDVLEPSEEFNITVFQRLAKAAIEDIYSRGKVPILAGGTGFYIQSVLYDIDFTENEENSEIREELVRISLEENGKDILFDMLREIDPKSAASIDKNNVKRIIRAIEFYKLSGKKISEHNEEQSKKEAAYNASFFVLTDDRKVLYERIDRRVDKMISDGLVDEVKALLKSGMTKDMVSMQGIGYKEIVSYLNGEITLDEAVYIIKRDTRHFAKRQITWFKREKDVIWFDRSIMSEDEIIKAMTEAYNK